jgi:hypothetical protein
VKVLAGTRGTPHKKYQPLIFHITFLRYYGDCTNYLIENSCVSIALLLMIRPIKSLFKAFITITKKQSKELLQWQRSLEQPLLLLKLSDR